MKEKNVETPKQAQALDLSRNPFRRLRSKLSWKFSTWSKEDISSSTGYLPPEILEEVFQYLPRRQSCHGFQRGVIPTECWSILRVCRLWYGAAIRVLYESIETRDFAATVKLSQALENNPNLSSFVRSIALPTRGRRCPPPVTKLHLRILNSLSFVEEVRAAVPFSSIENAVDWQLPQELMKHEGKLTSLCLHRYSHLAPFDASTLQHFLHLRYLNLEGFRSHKTSPYVVPSPLPHLQTIAFTYSSVVRVLDDWLLTCPNLTELRFHHMALQDNIDPLKICTEGKITRLSLLSCHYWHIYLAEWLSSAFKNLQTLEIPVGMFCIYWSYLPLILDELKLEVNLAPLHSLIRVLVIYLEAALLRKLVLVVEPHHASFQVHRERLLRLCSERCLTFEVEFLPCECKTRQEKAQDMLVSPWKKIVRKYKEITDEEAIKIMDWESPPEELDIILL